MEYSQVRHCPQWKEAVLTYDICRIVNKNHMLDATEIFRTLDGHKKEAFFKLGFYLLSFFYYLYRYVSPVMVFFNQPPLICADIQDDRRPHC